jgi:hypothetical protein
VVVHNLDIVSAAVAPAKADAVLIVDPDAVLPGALPLQGFESIARTGKKIAQSSRAVQGVQSPAGNRFDICETGDPLPLPEKPLGVGAAERLNHCYYYTNRFMESVNIYR